MYFTKLKEKIRNRNSVLCLGLDTDMGKLPSSLCEEISQDVAARYIKQPSFSLGFQQGPIPQIFSSKEWSNGMAMLEFNCRIIDATIDSVAVYKCNAGFYLAQGATGLLALQATVRYSHELGGLAILDLKGNDIGNSAAQYAKFAFEVIGADAATVNPYLGHLDAADAFTAYKDRGVYILCLTSNKGANEFQSNQLANDGRLLYGKVYDSVETKWNGHGNCGLVIGATRAEIMPSLRQQRGPGMPWLVPGFGKQEGDVENSVKFACSSGDNAVFNLSRELLYGKNDTDRSELIGDAYFARVAFDTEAWRQQINQFRPSIAAEVAS